MGLGYRCPCVVPLFDIVKPLGIKRLDRMKGAFWVMGDDLLGGVYALIVLVVAMQVAKLLAA